MAVAKVRYPLSLSLNLTTGASSSASLANYTDAPSVSKAKQTPPLPEGCPSWLRRGARAGNLQPAEAAFCFLFAGLQKGKRPAGRDPPVLEHFSDFQSSGGKTRIGGVSRITA
jgi:hypothetical protein